jgi:uncharacterized small protein (DUF1192 family)
VLRPEDFASLLKKEIKEQVVSLDDVPDSSADKSIEASTDEAEALHPVEDSSLLRKDVEQEGVDFELFDLSDEVSTDEAEAREAAEEIDLTMANAARVVEPEEEPELPEAASSVNVDAEQGSEPPTEFARSCSEEEPGLSAADFDFIAHVKRISALAAEYASLCAEDEPELPRGAFDVTEHAERISALAAEYASLCAELYFWALDTYCQSLRRPYSLTGAIVLEQSLGLPGAASSVNVDAERVSCSELRVGTLLQYRQFLLSEASFVGARWLVVIDPAVFTERGFISWGWAEYARSCAEDEPKLPVAFYVTEHAKRISAVSVEYDRLYSELPNVNNGLNGRYLIFCLVDDYAFCRTKSTS